MKGKGLAVVQSGSRIGPYVLGERIGQGGMGSVYKATASDGSVVAVKLLHMHLTSVEEYVQRFQREVKLAERLAHPNVVRVLGSGVEGGQYFMVMEFIEGESLVEQLLAKSGLPVRIPTIGLEEDVPTQRMRVVGRDVTVPCAAAPDTKSGQVAGKATAPGKAGSSPDVVDGEVPRTALPPVCNLPVPDVIRMLRQIAGVLQAAADIGLIHRDLKPHNILLDRQRNVKILDFGVAKDTRALASSLSLTGAGVGTPPYMSPEQCQGAAEVDIRSDLYSLGATAYCMLTGRPPFLCSTIAAYAMQHTRGVPVPVCKVNPVVPRNLSQVVDRLLAKKPEERHQTPAELIEDLNRVERGEPPLKIHKFRPSSGRRHLWVAAGIVAGVLLGGVGVAVWRGPSHAGDGGAVAEFVREQTLQPDGAAPTQPLRRETEADQVRGTEGEPRRNLAIEVAEPERTVEGGELVLTSFLEGVLSVDGVQVTDVKAGYRYPLRKVGVGKHELRVVGTDGAEWRRAVTVEAGQAIEIDARAPGTPAQPAMTEPVAAVAIPAKAGEAATSAVPAVVATPEGVADGAKGPAAGQPFVVPDLGSELVPINAGVFRMGGEAAGPDEKPVHQVTISRPFWLGKCEVTNAEYRRFLDAAGYDGQSDCGPGYLKHFRGESNMPTGDRHPVVWVSWNNAMALCRWLTEREKSAGRLPAGYEYRLPTEAEWEYACRAGTEGDHAGTLEDMAWFDQNSNGTTHEVGTKQPNAWGLHDMHGSVWEWCLDACEGKSSVKTDTYRDGLTDPLCRAGHNRINRGGSWGMGARYCRAAARTGGGVVDSGISLGFRIALAPVIGNP